MRRPSGGEWARRRRLLGWLCVAFLLLTAAAHRASGIRAHDVAVTTGPGGVPQLIEFPYIGKAADNSVLEFTFKVQKGWLTQGSVVFVPDDYFESLSVNGQDVPLGGVDPKRREDINRGFHLRIGPYLKRGDNTLVARVLNRGGPGGLDLRPDLGDRVNIAEALVAITAGLVLLALFFTRIRLGWPVTWIYIAGVAARFGYLNATPFPERSHDADGHVEYIRYILAHWAIPAPYDGWSFYQPPMYYALAAVFWKGAALLGITSTDETMSALQVLSVLCQLGFTLAAVLTADLWIARLPEAGFGRRLASRPAARALCAAVICFWPSAIIHSARVGNDDLLYLFFGGGFFFAVRWWLGGRDRDLTFAALWAAAAVWTKSNGLVLFILLACLCGVRVVDEIRRRELRIGVWLRRVWPTVLVGLVTVAGALGRAALDTASGKRANLLVGNADHLNKYLVVQNGVANYLWFDLKIFITEPFTSTFGDERGRQYFWNFTLKTGLFGEFTFDSPRAQNLAVLLSIALLALLGCGLYGVVRGDRASRRADLPAILEVVLLTASLAALRASIPMACSGDFRYILPVVGALAYLYVRGLVRMKELGRARLAAWGRGAGWAFAGMSAAFFVVVAFRW